MRIQGMHGSRAGAAPTAVPTVTESQATAHATATARRTAPLRVDAQRNLEHVLRAAREVFGELGYGAPMEDVARRARVGVGTVYRRFPSKDVLVRRIAEEETARLTEQARAALGQEEEPWSALSRFLRTSVASGAGRLLPPRILRAEGREGRAESALRVPPQRTSAPGQSAEAPARAEGGQPELRLVERAPAAAVTAEGGSGAAYDGLEDDPGAAELLQVVGQLVERARAAGELRPDVTVGDVLLVIATAAPSLPDAAQQAAASTRLLDILLEGLRSRSGR
ncbi:TetR family transcriptional regulator [Streptomyces qinglanensis]|uniref:TetR family transcriptional regulator n=1 Tax=Streptomyces qinglanensis TaxID=943816 RepID=A0A1E7KEJ5_9ACTN|nr:TetR/AcrR family transcriptional regulator [Streptomyces qinglanensis]OEV02304.1 TetR family transcriptional regulator [Streptomyces qinglanensis]